MAKVFVYRMTAKERENNKMIGDIDETLNAINIAYSKFNSVTDANIIEALLYEIKSLESKYEHLLAEAKEQNVIANAKRNILVPAFDAEYAIH